MKFYKRAAIVLDLVVSSVEAGTRISTCVTAANRFSDARHIDFKCPVRLGVIRTSYSSMLDQELILRQLVWYCNYPIEVKQKYLHLSIRNGDYIKISVVILIGGVLLEKTTNSWK